MHKTPANELSLRQIPLMQELIMEHPVYGSSGQFVCAKLIEDVLSKHWDRAWQEQYFSSELKSEPDYVDVGGFGEEYLGDEERPKINVYGVIDSGTDGPVVILNGHYDVDVVSEPHLWTVNEGWKSGKIIGDRLFGRGSSDMLGGLTSLIVVGSYFAERKEQWRGKIILSAVPDEEIGGNGTIYSFRTLDRLGYLDSNDKVGLIAEPTSNTVATRSLGFMHMQLLARRHSQHMGAATKSNNSLYDIIDVISGFEDLLDSATLSVLGTETDEIIHNFGIIEGGRDAAIPMGQVKAEATVFYPPEIIGDDLQRSILHNLGKKRIEAVSARFSSFGFRGHSAGDSRLGSILMETSESDKVKLGTFKSPCDARIFSTYGVEDVVVYGPGNLEDAHSIDESIYMPSLDIYNRHLISALSKLLKK